MGSQIIPITKNDPKLILKPGLSGLQHIKRNNINVDSIRKYENYYAMHHSLVFDIEILLKSIFRI